MRFKAQRLSETHLYIVASCLNRISPASYHGSLDVAEPEAVIIEKSGRRKPVLIYPVDKNTVRIALIEKRNDK